MGKESPCKARDAGRCEFESQVGKILWRRAWQFTPVFLPGESHGQQNLVGYSPWGHTESDMTEFGERRERTLEFCQWRDHDRSR